MSKTVVVFARAPRLGTVKRRLAQGIGDRAALRFHVATMTRLLRDLHAARRFEVVLAITPGRARMRMRHGARIIPQGRGDLGQRMWRALARYKRVALLGCDIPEANASDVDEAFRRLGVSDAVFGPAADGGFWLIALGPRRPTAPFRYVRWSTQHALADTLLGFQHHRVDFVRTLHDVDTPDDYHRMLRCKADGTATTRV